MTDLRLAVLIDADNIPHSSVKEMLEEITKKRNTDDQKNLC
jgi:hypothetical protein